MGKEQLNIEPSIHDNLVNYYSDKHYNGEHKDKIKEKLLSDPSSFQQALSEIHQDKYSDLDFEDFKIKYKSLYGDPFEKKTGSQPSLKPSVENKPYQPVSLEFENSMNKLKSASQPKTEPVQILKQEPKKDISEYNLGTPKREIATESTSIEKPITPESKVELKQQGYEAQKQVESEDIQKRDEERIETEAIDNGQGRASSNFGTFSQQLFSLPGDLLQTYAVATDQLARLFEYGGAEGVRGDIKEQAASKAADWYRESLKELYPDNPAYQDELGTKVSSALGQLGSLVLTGAATPTKAATSELQALTKESNLASLAMAEGKKTIATPPALAGAIQTGISEYNQAKASGASDDEAADAFIKNATVGGILESIPIMKFYKRLDKTTGGGLKAVLRNGATQGIEEMTTEVAQQFYSNVNASQTFDKTREWYDGMTESGGIGFGLGFLLGAMGTSLRKKQAEAKTPEEKAEIQKTIDFVNEKSGELNAKQQEIDRATNGETETRVEQPVSEDVQNQPVSETGIPEADKGVIDVTNLEEVIPRISEEVKNQGLSNSTIDAIDTEISSVSNKANSFDLELQKQDLYKQLDNPELPADQRGIIEAQINALESTIQNEEVTQDQEGQAKTEAIPVQEGQGLEEKPVVTQAKPEVVQESIPQTESGVQEPTPQVEETETPETKKRKFTQQVLNDPDISEEFKQGISEDTINYVPTTNDLNNKEADAFIEANGLDSALDKITDTGNGMKPKARVSVANKLIKQYNSLAKQNEANPEEQNRYLDRAIRTVDSIAKYLTELGQGVQAAAMYSRLSPEGILRYVQKEFQKTRKEKLDRVAPKLKKKKEALDQINQEAVEKVLSGKVKKIIESKVQNASENRKKAIKKANDFLEKLKIDTKGKAFDVTAGLPIAVWNGAISTIQKSLDLGLTIVEAIDSAVKYVKANHGEPWDEDKFRKKFNSDLGKYEASIDPKGATTKGLKDLDIKISDIVREHYTKVDNARKSLVQKILDNTDLTDADAKEIVSNIEQEFNRLTTEAKRKALIKGLSAKSILPGSNKEKQFYNEIIEMSNLGALSEKEWNDFYAKKFDLPELKPEQAKKLMELSDRVQKSKEGEQKVKATQDLLAYQEKLKGVNWADVGSSIWYANILSGLSTQTTNAYSGFMEVMGELAVSAIQNPKNTGFLLSNLFQGWGRGGLLGLDVFRTGYQPDKGSKIETPANLERIKFKGGKWNPFNYSKYVSRLMTAVDILHYSGIKQMRSAELALAMAQKEGKDKPTKEIKKRAIEILNNSKERIAEAKKQAEEEGLKGKDLKRRVFELVEQSRPEKLNEDAADFAAHGTFNYEPEGVVGALASALNGASAYMREVTGVNPLQFIVPFTRVVANVTNRSLDWTPHGYVRWLKGGMGSGKLDETAIGEKLGIKSNRWSTKYDADQKQRALIKATLGTMAMAALWAMSDEEEGVIQITADGTGDQQKNYELQGTGWRPYSVKIGDTWYNYQNTPLSIPFANIGFARDAMKYKGEKDIESKASIAMFGAVKYLMDMNFLSSLSGFFAAFGKNNPNGGEDFMNKINKEAARTAKGFIVPNAFTQASKSLQEIYEMPTKRADSVLEEFVRDMPGLRDDLGNMYNTLGEPVVPDQLRKFLPFKAKSDENNKVWDLIIENRAWIGYPSKSTIIYDPNTDEEREMTEKEYNKFSVEAGKLTKELILQEYDELKRMSKQEVQDRIIEIKKEAREQAKFNLFNN
jgi:hypothetical protein